MIEGRSLADIREDIDRIDGALLPLLEQRMACSREVAHIKAATGQPIFHPEREQEILQRVEKAAGDAAAIKVLYAAMMDISRAVQHTMMPEGGTLRRQLRKAAEAFPDRDAQRIACPGVPGSYSNEAVTRLFGKAERVFYPLFSDVFAAIERDEASVGVLPVENSSAGSVREVFDLILKHRFYIVGATELSVSHCLAGIKGSRREHIRTVYSHPQALSQCSELLKREHWIAKSYSNTAAAAEMTAEKGDPSCAALCSKSAAEQYGLTILAESVQNTEDNRTRFLVISRTLIIPKNADRISVCFSLPHTTGSLYRILQRFAVQGLNLTYIESRPIPETPFAYYFYLDFTGHVGEAGTSELLGALSEELPSFSFLGNYKEM